MLPLDATLRTLSSLAVLHGRPADAADLAAAAEAASRGEVSPGTSETVRQALEAIRTRGPASVLEEGRRQLPRDLRLLAEVTGLPLADLAAVHAATGLTSLGELRAAVDEEDPRLPPALLASLRAVLPGLTAGRPRTPLGRAWTLVEELTIALLHACPDISRIEPTGSLRRYAATSADLELLAAAADPPRAAAALLGLPFVSQVVHAGRARVILRSGRDEITIRLVGPDRFGAALVVHTGSPAHVAALRARARSLGLTLAGDGVARGGRMLETAAEADVYAALGLPCIPPELREGEGEVEAAAAGDLPALVAIGDIRGDLHMHTDWSDGHDPLPAMVEAAAALGYEYVAITDHSKSSAIARGLDAERLARQAEAVAAAREAHPEIAVLHGAEVDILPDGSLDFPDSVLQRLDVVLASLHDPAGHDGARLTRRYLRAMEHPLVQVVTHPTNRLVPGRAGYELDEERLFEAAARTGTILEIDGAPSHLDMDGAMARRAVRAGADVSIDGDCHRAEWLGRQMRFGVATARRGWIQPEHVVNTRPLPALRARLSRKRSGGA